MVGEVHTWKEYECKCKQHTKECREVVDCGVWWQMVFLLDPVPEGVFHIGESVCAVKGDVDCTTGKLIGYVIKLRITVCMEERRQI